MRWLWKCAFTALSQRSQRFSFRKNSIWYIVIETLDEVVHILYDWIEEIKKNYQMEREKHFPKYKLILKGKGERRRR